MFPSATITGCVLCLSLSLSSFLLPTLPPFPIAQPLCLLLFLLFLLRLTPSLPKVSLDPCMSILHGGNGDGNDGDDRDDDDDDDGNGNGDGNGDGDGDARDES